MNDDNKGKKMTPEEAVAAARKKKIQNFKLHIDDFGIGDTSSASKPSSRPEKTVKPESVDDILRDIESNIGRSKGNKRDESASRSKTVQSRGNSRKKPKTSGDDLLALENEGRFVPPVYVEPDLDKVGVGKKEEKSYADAVAAIDNFAPKSSETQEIRILARDTENKTSQTTNIPPASKLTTEENDAIETAKMEIKELKADEDVISSYSDEEKKKKMDLADKENLKAYSKSVKKRAKKKAKRNGCMFKMVWLVMVVFVSVLLGMFLIRGTNDMLALNRGARVSNVATDADGNQGGSAQAQQVQTASVDIPADASLDEVTDILYEAGVIKEPIFFKLYATITKSGEPFLEGTYHMETNMDYEAILNFLIYNSGPKNTVSISFTEGMSVRDIAKKLEENGVCKMDKFLDACNSDDFDEEYEFIGAIENDDERYYKLEGYLFPDTYTFYVNDSINNVVEKFLDNFNKKIYLETKRYSGYSEEMSIAEYAELKGMSVDYVINMASLLQLEAADEHDMYNISSIFFNRLSTDATDGITPYGDYDVNRLKSDVTVYYPYSSKEDVPEDQRETFSSSYNTYEIKGLPPGPVSNPGLKAIDAALNPSSTDYYFFCHKPATDTTAAVAYYASTYSEQIQNEIEAGLREEGDTE